MKQEIRKYSFHFLVTLELDRISKKRLVIFFPLFYPVDKQLEKYFFLRLVFAFG